LDKIKITPFSEAKDWESTVFELKLVLKQAWKDQTLDIGLYLSDDKYAATKAKTKEAATADKLIYYILSVGSVRGSYARNAIIAAQSPTAQPHIDEDDGYSLFKYFNSIFTSTEEHKTSLPMAQQTFHSLRQKQKESAADYIARTDLAVSTLAKLGEPVSANTWIFTLVNGLKATFEETRKGVMFGRPGFDTVLAVKDSIINEEIISTAGTPKDKGKDVKEKDSTAFAVADHSNLSCHYCGIKGHIQPDCRKKKCDEQQGTQSKGKTLSPKGKGGKNKSNRKGKGKTNKGKHGGNRQSNNWWTHENASSDTGFDGSYSYSKGQAQPWNSYKGQQQPSSLDGKGHSYGNGKGKGRGRGWSSGNFPSDCSGSYANVHQDSSIDHDTYSQSQWSDSSSQRWAEEHQDLTFVLLDNAHFKEESSSSRRSLLLLLPLINFFHMMTLHHY
jgi:hypothetical protein